MPHFVNVKLGRENHIIQRRIEMPEPFTLYKLIILYMLQKVDFPFTHSQISEFILDRGYTTNFTFQSVMSELMDSEMIRQETILNTTY